MQLPLSSNCLVLRLYALVLGRGMDTEVRELAKWDFNI